MSMSSPRNRGPGQGATTSRIRGCVEEEQRSHGPRGPARREHDFGYETLIARLLVHHVLERLALEPAAEVRGEHLAGTLPETWSQAGDVRRQDHLRHTPERARLRQR